MSSVFWPRLLWISGVLGIFVNLLLPRVSAQDTETKKATIIHTVLFPEGDAAWSVQFELESAPRVEEGGSKEAMERREGPEGSQRMKRVDIVRQGGLRRDIVHYSSGTPVQYWWTEDPPFVAYEDVQNGRVRVLKHGNLHSHRFDQELFQWVGERTFIDVRAFGKIQCRYYEKEIVLMTEEKALLRAWIDNETSRPVAWTDTAVYSLFTFDLPMPEERLVLPASFRQEIDRIGRFFTFHKKRSTTR